MNIAQQLSFLLNSKKISRSKLAREIGVHTSTVSNWLDGKDVKPDNLTALCSYFNCSPDYLMGWSESHEDLKNVGLSIDDLACELDLPSQFIENVIASGDIKAIEKIINTANILTKQNKIFSIPNILPLPKIKKVPLLGSIACGEPILAEQNIEDYIDIESAITADFALRCKGDSMIGARISDGDIVFIRQQPDVDDGEIAAVLIENEATLKRVFKIGSRLQLRAENISYPPMEFEGAQLSNVRILGKAVGFLSIRL